MKRTTLLFSRYLFLLIFGIFLFSQFSSLIQYSTNYFVTGILSFFHKIISNENSFILNQQAFQIIPACAAASAYYLLLILAFSIPLTNKKRAKLLILSFMIFFLANTLRIILLVEISKTPYFSTIHWITWHFLSAVFIFLIWVFLVKKLNISSTPFADDIAFLYHKSSIFSKIKPRKIPTLM